MNEKPEAAKQPNKLLILAVVLLGAVVLVLGILLLMKNAKTEEAGSEEAAAETSEQQGTDVSEATQETAAASEEAVSDESTSTSSFTPTVSYLHEADYFTDDVLSQQIAVCGDLTLTNRQLAYYYWMEYYQFLNQYYYYIYYYGVMDPYSSLDSQEFGSGYSFDQYMMNLAVSDFQIHCIFYRMAQDAGYEMSEEDLASFETFEEDLTTAAVSAGYETADEYIQAAFGPYCNVETYKEFTLFYMMADNYYDLYIGENIDNLEYSMDELLAYFDENADTMAESGYSKDDPNMVNVRHILITPEEVTLSEDDAGYAEAVQAANDAAKAKAEALLEEWKNGDMTEESFAALATANTEDTGSQETGGLYEKVYPGKMVDAFNNWCFDSARQPGDTGIVETEYGYHIMYFVSDTGMPYWTEDATYQLQNEAYTDLMTDLCEKYPMTSDLTNAAVFSCNTDQQ